MKSGSRTTSYWTVVGLLLAMHMGLAWHSTLQRSLTVDEIYHITGGYFFDRFGDYRLHPDNGVLPQRLHALPAVLMGAKAPPLEGNPHWAISDLFAISQALFYHSGNDERSMLLGARAMNLLFSGGVCLLVFAWARRLGGDLAGLVALGLAAFSPTLLAHGPLATTDVAATFFLLASTGAFGWQLREPSWRRTCLSAVVFGLACVAKYSAALLLPVFVLQAALHLWRPPAGGLRLKAIVGALVVHGAAAWAIIWACLGFRFSAAAPELPALMHFLVPWESVRAQSGWQGDVLQFLREVHFLPEAYLFGYLQMYVGALGRSAFLAGEYNASGWPAFFPLAFLWKSTPPELLGALLCLLAPAVRWRALGARWPQLAPLLIFTAVYGTAAILSHLNIGQRHLIPLYPVLFILTGVTVAAIGTSMIARALGVTLAVLQGASALTIHPYEMAYFNPLAGGPANGWRLLVDSSLDWGQDLPALRRWLEQNNTGPAAQPVFLSYFGFGEPKREGIEATTFLALTDFYVFPNVWHDLKPGVYAVSATFLQEVYSSAKPPWTLQFEAEYQALRALTPDLHAYYTDPTARPRLEQISPAATWERAAVRLSWLRHARLSAYLRARGPDDFAGYSILIFRLSPEEFKTALESPYSQWANAIETMQTRAEK